MKQKRELQVGQKVRGYGLLNEYGEFDFIPEETGSRKGKIKVVKEGDHYKVSSTVNTIQILISLDRGTNLPKLVQLSLFMNYVNEVIQILKSYDI